MKTPLAIISAVVATVTLATTPASGAIGDRSWAHYFAVKTAMQQLVDNDKLQQAYVRRSFHGTYTLELGYCEAGSHYLGESARGDVTADFADVAFDVILWREAFNRGGYPPDLWRKALTDYEQKMVDRSIEAPSADPFSLFTPFTTDMARTLTAYRRDHPSFPNVVPSGGCGSGPESATIAIITDPRGGLVSVIPRFYYALCKAENENADNPSACPRWRDVIQGKLEAVAGDYVYYVHWHDGTTRRGTLSFDPRDEGKTITLSKP